MASTDSRNGNTFIRKCQPNVTKSKNSSFLTLFFLVALLRASSVTTITDAVEQKLPGYTATAASTLPADFPSQNTEQIQKGRRETFFESTSDENLRDEEEPMSSVAAWSNKGPLLRAQELDRGHQSTDFDSISAATDDGIATTSNKADKEISESEVDVIILRYMMGQEEIVSYPQVTSSSHAPVHNNNNISNANPTTQQRLVKTIELPTHFQTQKNATSERWLQEIHYHQTHENRWSDRIILEMFYYAVTESSSTRIIREGLSKASSSKRRASSNLQNAINWMDPNVSICNWEGITCGDISAGTGSDKNVSPNMDIVGSSSSTRSNGNCWCVSELEVAEWDWPEDSTEEELLEESYLEKHSDVSSNEAMDAATAFALALAAAQRREEEEKMDASLDSTESMTMHRKKHCKCPSSGYIPKVKAPNNAITKIDLMEHGLLGTLLPELPFLKYLHRLNLNTNHLHGTIPSTYGTFENLHFIDLGGNDLTGSVPAELKGLNRSLDELWLEKNKLNGTFPSNLVSLNIEFFDLSRNNLTGTLPSVLGDFPNLSNLYIESNSLSGTIPSEIGRLSMLKTLDLSNNQITGSIPSELGACTEIVELNIAKNHLNGTFPKQFLGFDKLEIFSASRNMLSGTLPNMFFPNDCVDDLRTASGTEVDECGGRTWGQMIKLNSFSLERNKLSGSLPPNIFVPSIRNLDMSFNQLNGTLPSEIRKAVRLEKLLLQYNQVKGSIPSGLEELESLVALNLTGNHLTGTVPQDLCEIEEINRLYIASFECDSIACPPGTFHPDGAASDYGGCTTCPHCQPKLENESFPSPCRFLGQSNCLGVEYRTGDMDGDGALSQREILRLIYVYNLGENWGKSFDDWADMEIESCDLNGVNCKDGLVTKIDLREAKLCSSSNGGPGPSTFCMGLPAEIQYLYSIEVLDLSNHIHWSGSIPTEIGMLSNLRVLDMSRNRNLGGTIPTEIGNCQSLRVLNLCQGMLSGTLPSSLGMLTKLEKLNIGQNPMEGTIPGTIGEMKSLREMLISRAGLRGTLPTEVGDIRTLENLELYGNALTGPIPSSIENCASLKRIDMFNNKLTGTFPNGLAKIGLLQIVHLKNNQLSGTLPKGIGSLPLLSWLDLSSNMLIGTLPESLGTSQSLKDLRLGGNRLQSPVPESLCKNPQVNGGRYKEYGCDSIICPLGTHSDIGFATVDLECKPCPEGQTSIYLGSAKCRQLTQRDFLRMFFDVMNGEQWPEDRKKGWKNTELSECQWGGVTCDEDGNVVGLSFPVSSTAYSNEF